MVEQTPERSSVIVELERCMMPGSEAEHALRSDILSLTFYDVERLPSEALAQIGMRPQQCHNNVVTFAAEDPAGEAKVVSGWWRRGDVFVLHSVIMAQGRLYCVTPHADPEPLVFAPDSAISWATNGKALRKGDSFPAIVRTHPDAVIATAKAARDALLAGADLQSVRFPF